MTKHDLQIQRLEAAIASIKSAGGPDDLPFLADEELSLVERLERRIRHAAARAIPARQRRAIRDEEDARYRAWERAIETEPAADRVVCLDLREEEPVPFYLDAWEHEARGWSVR